METSAAMSTRAPPQCSNSSTGAAAAAAAGVATGTLCAEGGGRPETICIDTDAKASYA